MVNLESEIVEKIFNLLENVSDPEIPTINIVELGIVRDIKLSGEKIEVIITPTYSGCPAMKLIETEIFKVLMLNSFENVEIKTVLNPPWTTDWITEEGKSKLAESGISPPQNKINSVEFVQQNIYCPYCNSTNTILKSEFGSTACKSFYFCNNCLTPFDYFKAF